MFLMKPMTSSMHINGMTPHFLKAMLLVGALPIDSVGPMPQMVKGLHKPSSAAPSISAMVRSSMRDFTGGAIVVIEDDLPRYNPKVNIGAAIFGGNLRLFKPVLGQAPGLPVPVWMNHNIVMSGGNIVQQNYPMGWGY
jgi:hypothetical protein